MRNKDWSTLDIDKRWKWGVVLFKSNCIIVPLHFSKDSNHLNLKRQQNIYFWKCLFIV